MTDPIVYPVGTMTGEQKAHFDKLLAESFAEVSGPQDRCPTCQTPRACEKGGVCLADYGDAAGKWR